MREPEPVGLDEQLPESDAGQCVRCRCFLYYQRVEEGYPKHFFFCRRCGARYAAWETGWTPGRPTRSDHPLRRGLDASQHGGDNEALSPRKPQRLHMKGPPCPAKVAVA